MAKLQRSVWEIRFRSLMYLINNEQDCILARLGALALSDGINEEELFKAKVERELLKNLLGHGRNIETRTAEYLYYVE